MTNRIIFLIFGIIAGLSILIVGIALLAVLLAYPKLPSLEAITDYHPKIPLRVYSADGALIGEFGEERRSFLPISEVPQNMKNALLAAEDERFYTHGGVDYIGVLRAMIGNLTSGRSQSGASTITMQVARNFYLSNEKTLSRKFNEALLAFKIEHNLSKDQILELYINHIYLGQRAYGFGSAAQTYFGKNMSSLSVAEMAMLAGLPKAPSAYNPVVNPKRARLRQLYVLRRMHELKFISAEQYATAREETLRVRKSGPDYSVHGEYVAEMVRQMMYERYKEATYTEGYKVVTTIDSRHQSAAYEALRQGLLDYDTRRGYRGPEAFVDPLLLEAGKEDALDEALAEIRDSDNIQVAVVLSAINKEVQARLRGGDAITLSGDGIKLARNHLSEKTPPAQRIRTGAVIRVRQHEKGWVISQLPQIEGAFVSLDPENGAIKSLVGGFDFNRSSFNHVTQAWRQPGSSFKPYIYSAGLERGITPATLINDAPLVIDPAQIGGQTWEPKNYDGRYGGMMSVRHALTLSKNLVSIRILQAITPEFAQQHIARFGFDPKNHPAYLTMALGAGSVTPLQQAEGYAVFANTGFKVSSYFVDRIEDGKGRVLAKTEPEVAGINAERTLDARNAYVMTSMMQDVTRSGTAAKARVLGRADLAGKTGTTNDAHDAWFAGFQPKLVAVAWMGFDQPKSLGGRETGGSAALPIWISYMSKALKDMPEMVYEMPEGVVTQTIQTEKGPRQEYFFSEFTHTNPELGLGGSDTGNASAPAAALDDIKDLLF